MRSSPWIRGAPHRKFSRAIRVIKLRISPDILGRPPRQRPPDRYLQSSDQPLRRQRSTVAGWTISRLSRQFGHHPRQQDPSQSIPQTKTWAAGSAPLQHRNLMAQCDRLPETRSVRVRGSPLRTPLRLSPCPRTQVIARRSNSPINQCGSNFEEAQLLVSELLKDPPSEFADINRDRKDRQQMIIRRLWTFRCFWSLLRATAVGCAYPLAECRE